MRSDLHRLLLGLGIACLALPAHADWKRDYDRGMRAFEKENWSEAEAAFRAALSEEPAPDARKRFQGVRTAVYVPHYYAGVSAWRQGGCERAMQYWSNAASTAVVAGIGKLDAEQERGMSDCRRRLAASAPATSPATASTATPPPVGNSATKPPATPATVSSSNQGKPATAATTPPAATPPRSAPNPPATSPSTATTRPAATTTPLTTTASSTGASAALVAAVEHYLAGRYSALLQLDPVSFADGRSRAQAYLLRAAARHAVAAIDGGESPSDAIGRDIRAARAANASLQPDAVLFSPRFRALWQQTR